MTRRHRDIAASEIEWREGSDPGIKFALYRTDEENVSAPAIVLSTFEPGTVVPPHTHGSSYFEYILEGEQMVGKTRFGPGDIRIVKGGTGYGPIRVGPAGCKVMIVFENASEAAMVPLPRAAA